MFFTGLGTALPAARYSQHECWQALRTAPQFARLRAPSRALLERVLLADNGIRTRHLALEKLEDAFELSPDVLHARFAEHAPALATRAGVEALARARVAPQDIDALIVSTCTGYLCPGLTSLVGERLGLRAEVIALDLVGQGCGAALPNLRAASALLAGGGCDRVLSICVEVCSAAFYLDDDPGVLLSACLFGDGAAAAVLSREPSADARRLRWIEGFSLTAAQDRAALRMEHRGGMLRNILSRSVPATAARRAVLARGLAAHGLAGESIRAWIWHAGGRTVLDRLREATGLEEAALARSREALSRFGNLSSPFVFFVLEATLREGAPDGWWWMSSFGAGFSCHGALLRAG
jgi:alkylresorcinol/alkylpyrone synthase